MSPALKHSLYSLAGAGLLCFAASSVAQANAQAKTNADHEQQTNTVNNSLVDLKTTSDSTLTSNSKLASDSKIISDSTVTPTLPVADPETSTPVATDPVSNAGTAKPSAPYYSQANSSPPRIGSGAHLLNVTLGLLFIVALIFGISWFVRRFGQGTFSANTHMKIIAAMPLGTRERIVLIDAGGQQLLLGITPTQINTLHVFDTPIVTNTSETNSSEFSRKLMAILQRSGNDETNNNKSFKKQE